MVQWCVVVPERVFCISCALTHWYSRYNNHVAHIPRARALTHNVERGVIVDDSVRDAVVSLLTDSLTGPARTHWNLFCCALPQRIV